MTANELLKLKVSYVGINRPDWDSSLKEKLIEDFTYHSSKIEGLKLDYGDTIRFLRTGLVKSQTSPRDIADLKNHQQVLRYIFDNYPHINLNQETIKELHALLMKDRVQWHVYDPLLAGAGQFKTESNFGTRAKEFKEYLAPELVEKEIINLCRDTVEALHAPLMELTAINRFHYVFLNEIHPFTDGNGRIARLLHNLLLIKKGYPMVIVEASEKSDYINALIEQEKKPASQAFDNYMNKLLAKRMVEIIG